jgi:hypothetical protein
MRRRKYASRRSRSGPGRTALEWRAGRLTALSNDAEIEELVSRFALKRRLFKSILTIRARCSALDPALRILEQAGISFD